MEEDRIEESEGVLVGTPPPGSLMLEPGLAKDNPELARRLVRVKLCAYLGIEDPRKAKPKKRKPRKKAKRKPRVVHTVPPGMVKMDDIAARFGVGRTLVSKWISAGRVATVVLGRAFYVSVADAERAYEQTYPPAPVMDDGEVMVSVARLAEELGLGRRTISNYVYKNGLTSIVQTEGAYRRMYVSRKEVVAWRAGMPRPKGRPRK